MNLEQFKDGWMSSRSFLPPSDPYCRINETIAGTVIYRQGQFQVEMLICEPNSEIKNHRHPNIDSFEVYVSGDVYFRHGNQQVVSEDTISDVRPGMSIRVRPNHWHGASIGPRGGSFLSVQKWNEGVEPSCVYVDWEGPSNNPKAESRRLIEINTPKSDDEILGRMIRLAIQSPIHRKYTCEDLARLFIPPIQTKQYLMLEDGSAFCTWAYLSKEAADGFLTRTRKLRPSDWTSGPTLMAVDFIAAPGRASVLARRLRAHFPKNTQGLSTRLRHGSGDVVRWRNA